MYAQCVFANGAKTYSNNHVCLCDDGKQVMPVGCVALKSNLNDGYWLDVRVGMEIFGPC